MTTRDTVNALYRIEDRLMAIEGRLKLALGFDAITPSVPLAVLDDLAALKTVRDELYTLATTLLDAQKGTR
jgi:hypothetical protein